MPDDAPRRQTAFSLEIVTEVREYLVLRSDPRWLRWRDHTGVAQHRKKLLQCRTVARVAGTLTDTDMVKPFDHRIIYVGHPKAAVRYPLHEVADQTERPKIDQLSEPNT